MRELHTMTEDESVEIGVWHYWHVFQHAPQLWKHQFYTLIQIDKLISYGFDIKP